MKVLQSSAKCEIIGTFLKYFCKQQYYHEELWGNLNPNQN